jgi:hypothetical protein
MDDHVRQTGKYKRIVGLPDLSTNTDMSMAFLSPQWLTVTMYTNLILEAYLSKNKWHSKSQSTTSQVHSVSAGVQLLDTTTHQHLGREELATTFFSSQWYIDYLA